MKGTLLPLIYRGVVVDTKDPKKLGRVKVKVLPQFQGIDNNKIPWAIPASPLYVGAGVGFGGFFVPEVNSYVYVFFEQGDCYQPVYFAEAQTAKHGLPSEKDINYPNRRIWKTKGGIVIYTDDTSGSQEVDIIHPAGAYIKIDNSGNVIIKGTTVSINPL